jgi:hypothetical protein
VTQESLWPVIHLANEKNSSDISSLQGFLEFLPLVQKKPQHPTINFAVAPFVITTSFSSFDFFGAKTKVTFEA